MQDLWGRKVLHEELHEQIESIQNVNKLPTMERCNTQEIQCLRCGQVHLIKSVQLIDNSYFCPSCIQLNRVVSNQFFYHLPEPNRKNRKVSFEWKGELSKGQQVVSNQLVETVQHFTSRLVWAVTGAGKTELLFDMLHYCLERGDRVCICSPRVDVCLELYPRVQEVFPNEPIALLHGAQKEKYFYTKLVLCTTHQLFRFYQAFDVVVIDEVDAFPFVGNQSLNYAVKQSIKATCSLIYLTATPTQEMMKKIKNKELEVSLLPARYHRRVVPVPEVKWCFQWSKYIKKKQLPRKFIHQINDLVSKNNLLIFCPSIYLVEQLYKKIKHELPELSIAFVHSKDPERLEKVRNMRNKKYKVLVTSTVLERGVTFERVSVLVFGANHPVFNAATLVQIAGRVDRKMDYSFGQVYFFHDGYTKAMKKAIQQIKKMNQLGLERGLIDGV